MCQVLFYLIVLPHSVLTTAAWNRVPGLSPFYRRYSQGHIADEYWNQIWNSDCLTPMPVLLTTVPCIKLCPLRNPMKPEDRFVKKTKCTFSFFQHTFYWILRLWWGGKTDTHVIPTQYHSCCDGKMHSGLGCRGGEVTSSSGDCCLTSD